MSKRTNQLEELFGPLANNFLKKLANFSYIKERILLIDKNLAKLKESSQTSQLERAQKLYQMKDAFSDKSKELSDLNDSLEELKNKRLELQTQISSGSYRFSAILLSPFSNEILSLKQSREKLLEINSQIEEQESALPELNRAVQELKQTIHQLDKPQQDIDYAIKTLALKKIEALKELKEQDSKIDKFLEDFCFQSSLNQLENSCLSNAQVMQTLWKIADASRELRVLQELKKTYRHHFEKKSLSQIYEHGCILPKTFTAETTVPMTGRGTHHRKVSSGTGQNRRSRWKVFQVEFNDSIKIRNKVKATQLHKRSLIKNLHSTILAVRQEAFNKQLKADSNELELKHRLQSNIKLLKQELTLSLEQI